MACNKTKYVGRDVVLEYAMGCGDTLPDDLDWKILGSLRTKDFSIEWETTDATADDSIDSLRENLATFLSLSISGDGTCKASGLHSENQIELTKHVVKPESTGGQPTAWVRMTFPDLTFTAYMLITNMSRSAPYDDVVTFSFEASNASSDFGVIVEDTPNPDAPEVTGVTVVPATLSMEIGEAYDLEAVVLPTNAGQGVSWTSADPDVATVNAITGVVTAISDGTTSIAAVSTIDPLVSGTCAVTVTV